eukprot:scaffold7246_cov136-Skeletonema_marinoi.AAC.14
MDPILATKIIITLRRRSSKLGGCGRRFASFTDGEPMTSEALSQIFAFGVIIIWTWLMAFAVRIRPARSAIAIGASGGYLGEEGRRQEEGKAKA